MQAAVAVDAPGQEINPEEIRARLHFRSENYIEEVSQEVVSLE